MIEDNRTVLFWIIGGIFIIVMILYLLYPSYNANDLRFNPDESIKYLVDNGYCFRGIVNQNSSGYSYTSVYVGTCEALTRVIP